MCWSSRVERSWSRRMRYRFAQRATRTLARTSSGCSPMCMYRDRLNGRSLAPCCLRATVGVAVTAARVRERSRSITSSRAAAGESRSGRTSSPPALRATVARETGYSTRPRWRFGCYRDPRRRWSSSGSLQPRFQQTGNHTSRSTKSRQRSRAYSTRSASLAETAC